jgi:hypothetical protein
LDWFDFLWETYSSSTKEKLIELMGHALDVERLKEMTREDLADEYCARMASAMMTPQKEKM